MFCRIRGNEFSPRNALRGSPTAHDGGSAPERLVVRPPVVVAGDPESGRGPEDEERGRERQPRRPPGRLRPEQAVRRVAEQLGRVQRREVAAVSVVLALDPGPGQVDEGRRQTGEDGGRLHPPGVAPRRFPEPPHRYRNLHPIHLDAPLDDGKTGRNAAHDRPPRTGRISDCPRADSPLPAAPWGWIRPTISEREVMVKLERGCHGALQGRTISAREVMVKLARVSRRASVAARRNATQFASHVAEDHGVFRLSSNGCGWVEARSAGRRGVLAVHLTGGGRGAPWPGVGRSGVAAGRTACQRATRVLRCAAALRVTHRPSLRSSSRYGPCGPAWTGASRPSTTTRKARRLAARG